METHKCSCHNHSDHGHGHEHGGCQCGHCHDGHLDDMTHQHGLDLALEAEIEKSVQEVWSALCQPQTWFDGLVLSDPRPGGHLLKKGPDSQTDSFMIMDFEDQQLLSFTWYDQTIISIEVFESEANLTHLSFHYWLPEIGNRTIQDILAWVVGLKQMDAQLQQQDFKMDQEERKQLALQIEDLLLQQAQIYL